MKETEEPLEGLTLASPPAELRAQCLASAKDAWTEQPVSEFRIDLAFVLKLAAALMVLLGMNGLCQRTASQWAQGTSPWADTIMNAPAEIHSDPIHAPLSMFAKSTLAKASTNHEHQAWHLRQHALNELNHPEGPTL